MYRLDLVRIPDMHMKVFILLLYFFFFARDTPDIRIEMLLIKYSAKKKKKKKGESEKTFIEDHEIFNPFLILHDCSL